jgi:NAD+ diphosphatase
MASLFDGLPAPEASSLTGFSGNRIDRRSENRTEESVPAALADPAARLYLFRGDQALVRGAEPLFTAAEARGLGAEPERTILLGWAAAGPRLAAELGSGTAVDDPAIRLVDLRTLAVEGAVRRGRSATGTPATASAPSAASRRRSGSAATGATAPPAAPSIFPAPTRS